MQLRRITSPIRSLSLRHKLLLILIVFSVLPSLLVFGSSERILTRSNTNHSTATATLLLEAVASDLVKELRDLGEAVNTLLVNYEFQQFVNAPKEDYALQARLALSYKQQLEMILSTYRHVEGIVYTDKSGKVFYSSYESFMDYSYPLQDDPIYGTGGEEPSGPTLSDSHRASYLLGTPYEVYSLIFPVHNLRTGHVEGKLFLEIKTDYVLDKIHDRQVGTAGPQVRLFLANRETGTVAGDSEDRYGLVAPLRQALTGQSKAQFRLSAGQGDYEVLTKALGYGSWELVWAASLDDIAGGVRHARRSMLLVAGSSLLVALLIAYMLARIVWRPMNRLRSGIEHLSQGRYLPVPEESRSDEVGLLISTFNRMLVNLQQLEQDILESRLNEKERELLQLQAQINPHLLFNTLETIDSYASRHEGEAVSEMVQAVAAMMRFAVRQDGGWAPLGEELAYIRQFLDIHTYRYGTGIEVIWDIEPECLAISVMKLSLQPFVENALKYGWTPDMTLSDFRLEIRIRRKAGGLLEFAVSDTGIGVDPEVMTRLNTLDMSRKNGGKPGDPYFSVHTGIWNVCRRFHLAYGERAALSMKPNIPQGTVVTGVIPAP